MNRLPETNQGTVTSWIPISIAHPHQAGCDKYLWKYVANTIAAWDPGYGISVQTDATCLPKPVTTWWLQDRFGPIKETILSIGPITCPQDYYTATASAKDSSSTFVACCPLNYDFVSAMAPGDTGQCTSDVKKGGIITFAQKDANWKVTSSTATQAMTIAAIPVNGWSFATPTNSAAENDTDICAASVSDALANHIAASTASCDATNDGGISSSTAAGIGLGAFFGVTGLAALGAGLFMMFRARKAARQRPTNAHIAHFVNNSGKDMNSSAQVLTAYSPEPREAYTPPERPQYHQVYQADVWDVSAAGLPPQSFDKHTYAKTVPHGEMEGTAFKNIDARTRRRMELEGTMFQDTDGRTMGVGTTKFPIDSSRIDSEEEIRRRMELEGEFDRNVKVSLTSPWLTKAKPLPSSESSSSSQHHLPY
ncbi:uncharacterized protein GGS22DRAFT_130280 [Annulohypoxylon maeteangense]|uniref:uncharacterized protein n=1 Tax=Annulohypoxylon maeteangense TaxID=1927788 RepID=UPI0020076368|nr:uncharacterized protein GGS22DRAFT_130280 [Annulohypoxylon maeteangense]KAI0885528.1 hypothetical protein GGS22DRAFT_130280 [Annulohypoxylon maeteangense]